jgi:hypothetical protein
VDLVELRVAHPGGEVFDDHMARTRVTDLQIIDLQPSADFNVDCRFDLHGAPSMPTYEHPHCDFPYEMIPAPSAALLSHTLPQRSRGIPHLGVSRSSPL